MKSVKKRPKRPEVVGFSRRVRRPGIKANYGDATPEDVARVMLMKNRAPFKSSKKADGE